MNNVHTASEFSGSSNLRWVAHTANRRYSTWQSWLEDAKTGDTLAAKIADRCRESYVDFVKKYNGTPNEAAEAVQ